tara:strand:+ start:738 stop:1148 length:411 start_codon:yes stop_codon:yes gene_type:complete
MIFGTGIDMIKLDRVSNVLNRYDTKFPKKILGLDELEKYYYYKKKDNNKSLSFLASRFAAKEAFSKALGLGIRAPMSWKNIQFLNNKLGAPKALIMGSLKKFMDKNTLVTEVSISDTKEYCIALIILLQIKNNNGD